MAKRLTDAEKWDDPWFADLSIQNRLAWIYILDKCNHAGIWKVNKRMAEFCLGYSVDWDEFLSFCGDRIIILSAEKWHIPKFVEFQYGELQPQNRVHASVLALLKKEGAYKGHTRPLQGHKDKDKDKDKVKDKDINAWFEEIWKKYPSKDGKKEALRHFRCSVRTEADFQRIQLALTRYLQHLSQNSWKQPKNGATWFNNWQDWENWTEPEKPKTRAEEAEERLRKEGILK